MRQAGLIVGSHEGLGWMGKVSLPWAVGGLHAQVRSFSGRVGAEASHQDSRGEWAVRVLGLWV